MTTDRYQAWRTAKRDFCARRDALAGWLERTGDCPDPFGEASRQMDAEYMAIVRQHLG
jgi:hypothetical protein